MALLGAPLIGWSSDRFDRKFILALTAALGIIGFGGFGIVSENPRGGAAFIFAMLSGNQLFAMLIWRIKSNWRNRYKSRIIYRTICR